MFLKKFLTAFAISLVAYGVLVSGGYYIYGRASAPINEDENVDKSIIEESATGKINVLLVGVDKSAKLTDTIMLMCFDRDNSKINITSIPRDTRIYINNSPQKINSCMVYGDLNLLINEIKRITGAPVNYYVTTDFEGFRNIIDTLDGVTFDVPQNMRYSDPSQGLYINLKKGEQLLDGKKAEQLVRFRGYPEADLARTDVQRRFLKELITQKLKPEYLLKIPALFSQMQKSINTNFSVTELAKNISAIKMLAKSEPSEDDTDSAENNNSNIEIFEIPGEAQMIDDYKTGFSLSYFIIDEKKTKAMFAEHFNGIDSAVTN